MYHKLLITVFTVIFSDYYCFAQSADTVKSPAEDYVKSIVSDSLLQNLSQHIICQITADFNSDGIKDMAISDSFSYGANGCNWAIYLGLGNESYKFFSTLWFHNYAIRIDSVAKGISNIYIYVKTNAGVGDIIEYNVSTSNGIKKMNQKTIYPETFPENEDYKYYISIFTQPELKEYCKNFLEYLKK